MGVLVFPVKNFIGRLILVFALSREKVILNLSRVVHKKLSCSKMSVTHCPKLENFR